MLRHVGGYFPLDLGPQTPFRFDDGLYDQYESVPSFEFPFDSMAFRSAGACAAPSSFGSASEWTNTSSDVAGFPSCNLITPPDSAFGSYTEQSRPGSPYCRDRAFPQAREPNQILTDSGVEQSRPASPNAECLPGSKQSYGAVLPDAQKASAAVVRSAAAVATCTNCFTQTTPLWRINHEGQLLCNACGLFFKLHGEGRPTSLSLSLKMDLIKKRNCGVEDVPAFLRQKVGDSGLERRYSPGTCADCPAWWSGD